MRGKKDKKKNKQKEKFFREREEAAQKFCSICRTEFFIFAKKNQKINIQLNFCVIIYNK